MKKPILWLLLSRLDHPEVPYVIPTLAWMARESGALFEIYLESERTGALFAETGSTILGGNHHHQFNYLCARFEVVIFQLGTTAVFESSVQAFNLSVAASSGHAPDLYSQILKAFPELKPSGLFYGPARPVLTETAEIRLQPFLFPEILHRKALGLSAESCDRADQLISILVNPRAWAAFTGDLPGSLHVEIVDKLEKDDDWHSITLRICRRWKEESKGVVFGDPAAVLSQLATHCRHDRVAIYAPVQACSPAATRVSNYVEAVSPAAADAAELAVELGNPILYGRQTGDGDIFEWSKRGVCIQIVDPNRPAFPVIELAEHPWNASSNPMDPVPDHQLIAWAKEGRVLTSLLVHSGEIAHNEAMLALVEMAGWNDLKIGIGVHSQRYETCPQLWELLAVARDHGGAASLVEPVLHSGGRGVLAEYNCPPDLLAEHCHKALERIRQIAGPLHTPTGYYSFMDSNLDLLNEVRGDLFSAIAASGLTYIVSSARPGRNRLLWKSDACAALNQTVRVLHACSPFVRGSTADDFDTGGGAVGPGWFLASLDAPVVAFPPYIWREGNKIIELADTLRRDGRINVLPSTIARYARVLEGMDLLPKSIHSGKETVLVP